jgi:hypothetical protein
LGKLGKVGKRFVFSSKIDFECAPFHQQAKQKNFEN